MDNRAGSASGITNSPYNYGLGLINSNKKFGYYSLSFWKWNADDATTTYVESNNNDSTWQQYFGGHSLTSAKWITFDRNDGSGWAPIAITQATMGTLRRFDK
jgi:hypothetical protein